MGERQSSLLQRAPFSRPSRKANCVQIGPIVTDRRPGESVAALLDRAVREYPDKRATLVVVGWR